jgi:hypothetical protein
MQLVQAILRDGSMANGTMDLLLRRALGISRNLVYRRVAKFRMAAAGFANRSGVLLPSAFY